MAITLSSTKQAFNNGIKCLVFGQSGVGKTRLSSTLPGKTLILSAEAGLLSLREYDIDAIVINSVSDLRDAYTFIASPDGDKYQNIVLDSLSEIAEQVLSYELSINKDGRAAYGELSKQMTALTKAFRDMHNKNVMCIAKAERSKDDASGKMLYAPSFPGQKLTTDIPYLFDELFYLHAVRDEEGNVQRYLQTVSDDRVSAKDRSGVLNQYEPADLTEVFSKINGRQAEPTTTKKGGK